MKDIDWVVNLIRELASGGYTGKLEVNFFKGGVSNINKTESIKPQSERKG